MEKIDQSLVPVVQDGNVLRSYERQMLACLNGSWTSYTDWFRTSGLAKSTFSRGQKQLLALGMIEHDPQQGWRSTSV
jgi:hypothetical protein